MEKKDMKGKKMAEEKKEAMGETKVLPQVAETEARGEEGESGQEKSKKSVFSYEKESGKLTVLGRAFDKKQVCMAGIGLLCAVAVAGGGIWAYVSSNGGNDGTAVQAVAAKDEMADSATEETEQVLDLGVTADGWDATASSPVIVHIESEDGSVDFYHAYNANERTGIAVGEEGTYKVSFISPVNSDGSIYRVGDATQAQTVGEDEFDSAAGGTESDLPFTFEKVEADAVTEEELTSIAKDVAEAVKKGDETLTGENGTNVVSKVDENIKKNPSANADAVTEETSKAEETAKNEESAAKKSDKSDSSGSSKKSDSGSSSSKSQGSSGSTMASGSSSSKSESTAHQHSWVAQTKTIHHDAVTHQEAYTVHHDAVTHTETVHHDAVTEHRSICNICGADITGHTTEHMESSFLNGGNCTSYSTKIVTVKAAYDETVTVTDKAAYDETKYKTVTDSAAYDETVTTGYKCSGCNATKGN